jgi:hypothetical protein
LKREPPGIPLGTEDKIVEIGEGDVNYEIFHQRTHHLNVGGRDEQIRAGNHWPSVRESDKWLVSTRRAGYDGNLGKVFKTSKHRKNHISIPKKAVQHQFDTDHVYKGIRKSG